MVFLFLLLLNGFLNTPLDCLKDLIDFIINIYIAYLLLDRGTDQKKTKSVITNYSLFKFIVKEFAFGFLVWHLSTRKQHSF